MARTRVILLSLLAVFALSAVASASASAATWKVAGAELKSGETKELAEATTNVENAKLTVAGVGVTVTCTGLKAVKTLIIGTASGSASKLSFTGCTATSPCTVPSTISSKELSATVATGTAPETILTISPKTGKVFANIEFGGETCALFGTQPVSGKVTATSPDGQTEQVEHELVVASSGELEVGAGNSATLKGKVKGKLASGSTWSFK